MAVQRRLFKGPPKLTGRHPSDYARELYEFLRKLYEETLGIPGGFIGTIATTIQAGVAAAAGALLSGWAAADHTHAVETTTPPNPTGPVASEGTGTALMRADATIKQGIVVARGELLGHDGTTAVALPAPTMHKGCVFVLPGAPVDITLWRASWPCTVTAVKAYRVGGTSATINARRNGTAEHLAADLVTGAGAWVDGGAVQNAAYVAGDSLEARLKTAVGAIAEVAVQVEFTRP